MKNNASLGYLTKTYADDLINVICFKKKKNTALFHSIQLLIQSESNGGWRKNNDKKGNDCLSLRVTCYDKLPVVRYLSVEVKGNK